ncbi:MAG TPA: hypothetical protein VGS07_20680 [Thermoanaerobaculia bacterium]|jgi:hypothetical protein|nr:hypothetical protein [Thermoanaerobaculia bacterium]
MIWSGRRRGLAIAFLSVAVLGLVVANLVKWGLLTWDTFKDHKDSLGAASSVVSMVVLTVGAVLSYFRFFHGRTFATRAELDLVVCVYSLPNGRMLHTISLSLKNVGGSAIWNPQPVIAITVTDDSGSHSADAINRWWDPLVPTDGAMRVAVVDTGETVRFPTYRDFDAQAWIVTYFASVTCDSGDVWKYVHIVRNVAPGIGDRAPDTGLNRMDTAPLRGPAG